MKIHNNPHSLFALFAAICVMLIAQSICFAGGKFKGPRIVVMDFDGGDQVGDKESSAMADRLSNVIEKTKTYDVVPRKDFKKAVKEHEKKTGKPCKDKACLNSVARSMGAHPLETSIKKDGSGCSVSVGLLGSKGKPMVGGKVKNPCSPAGLKVATDGAVLFMSNDLYNGAKVDDIDLAKEKESMAASEAPPQEAEEQLDAEFDAATETEQQHDTKAEQNAKRLEEEARRKLGLGR